MKPIVWTLTAAFALTGCGPASQPPANEPATTAAATVATPMAVAAADQRILKFTVSGMT